MLLAIKNRFILLASVLFLLLAAILLTGCGTAATASDPSASAAVAEQPAAAPATEAPAKNDFIKGFGEIVTYADGVSISVSEPVEFTPTNLDYMPLPEGFTALAFKVVLTNNSSEVLNPGAVSQASSGGKPAVEVADAGNTEFGTLGLFPTTAILPGQTIEWYVGFAVADPASLTFQVSPYPIGYDNAIFTNVAL